MVGSHFHDAFWYPPSTRVDDYSAVPDFKSGLNVLHERLGHSELENQDIIRYVRARIASEQVYAENLTSLEDVPCLSDAQETGLSQCFAMIRRESSELASAHTRLAQEISTMVLEPLVRLAAKYRRVTQTGRETMDAQIRQFDTLYKPLSKLRQVRDKRFAELHHTNAKAAKIPDQVTIHGIAYSPDQFQDLVFNLKQAVAVDAVPEKAFVEYLISNRITNTDEDAKQVIARLVELHVLKPAQTEDDASALVYEFTDLSISSSDPSTSPGSTTKIGALFGMWNQYAQDDTSRQKLHATAEAADEAFRTAVEKADGMRLIVEEAMFAHLDEMENIEFERIRGLKQAFTTLAATMSNIIPNCKDTYDRLMLYQETLRPATDVQYMVEQYRTGRYCPRPILYVDYHNKPRTDRHFGVPLDALAETSGNSVPKIISEGLQQLDKVCKRLFDEEISVIWVTDVPLDRVHEARAELNHDSDFIDHEKIKTFDPLLLAALLRLYLQELPECLLTFDLYDPVKVLYANNNVDNVSRIQSLANLLSTLPASNYETTEILIRHLHGLASDCQAPLSETLPSKISAVLGPILLRPRVDSTLTVHDKCPHRLVTDLIEFCDAIFSERAHESHLHNVQRSALVAPSAVPGSESADDTVTNTTTHLPTRRKTILSYIRSSIKPVEEPFPPPPMPATNHLGKPTRPPIAPPRSSTLFDMDGRASPRKGVFRRSSDTALFSRRSTSSQSIVSKDSSDHADTEHVMSPISIDNIDAFFDD